MELKKVYEFFKAKRYLILISGIIGSIVGTIVYMGVPNYKLATGTIFINRTATLENEEFFTYEGYYGQQAAQAYTNSIIGLVESVNIRSDTLERSGNVVTLKELNKLKQKITTKKVGPQVIELTIKEKNAGLAQKTWEILTQSLLETTIKLSQQGDTALKIQLLDTNPIITDSYKNIYINIILGFLIGSLVSVGYLSLKEYLE